MRVFSKSKSCKAKWPHRRRFKRGKTNKRFVYYWVI